MCWAYIGSWDCHCRSASQGHAIGISFDQSRWDEALATLEVLDELADLLKWEPFEHVTNNGYAAVIAVHRADV